MRTRHCIMGPIADAMTELAPGRRSLPAIHLAVLLFGFPGLFAGWIPLPPSLLVLGRVVFAAPALAVFMAAAKVPFRMAPGRDLLLCALCGIVLALHWSAFFEAVRVSSVAVGLLAYATFPAFTVFLEPLFERKRRDGANVLFSGLTLLGVFLVVPRFALADPVLLGVLWGLLSGAAFAILSILNRNLTRRQASLRIAFYQDLFAGVVLLPVLFGGVPRLSGKDLALLAVLGVLCTAVAHTLFIRGMRDLNAQTASLIAALEPVYGILFALVLLGEVPTGRTVMGGAIILGAVLLVTLRGAKSRAA
jgi:drug/metabolite transporter (DMT)-like permease